jgi:HAD superfamily hydrolase (TIGR01509 family)
LLEHERDLALGSRPAPGAVELVRELAGRGYRLGILTRNARELAHVTLEAIGLADCFAAEDVLGRDEAPPKPHPGGLLKLAHAWDVAPSELVMVGDYRFDLDCGRAAGARTVLVNLPDNPWPELTDWHAQDCVALRQMLLA